MKISILILTLNEETNIGSCLDTLAWCDDIVVLDSFSQDQTVQIAKAKGARVFQRRFDDYASQRNYGLKSISYSNQWILMVDADERWPDTIYDEIRDALDNNSDDISLYYFRRKDMFMGRWLRRSSGYPTWAGRLVKPDKVTVRRGINEEYCSDGGKGYLQSHFIHYPFNKGIAFWIERHNRYSSIEAETQIQESRKEIRLLDLFSPDPTVRRKVHKRLAFRIPFRPILVFLYLFFVRFGFLDGKPGSTYCTLRAIYEYMIDLKVMELRKERIGRSL